jgi:hypothetical protein
MSKIKCLTCGTTKAFPTQGHHIDGSWIKDHTLPKRQWGGWVCSFRCYEQLLENRNSKINKKILKKEV